MASVQTAPAVQQPGSSPSMPNPQEMKALYMVRVSTPEYAHA
jgi:hypothetical protein